MQHINRYQCICFGVRHGSYCNTSLPPPGCKPRAPASGRFWKGESPPLYAEAWAVDVSTMAWLFPWSDSVPVPSAKFSCSAMQKVSCSA